MFSIYSDQEIEKMKGYVSSGVNESEIYDNNTQLCGSVCLDKEFLASVDDAIQILERLR